MNTQEQTQTRRWLTVDQAFAECQAAGLSRTKKTIRAWCRHEHVESQKQTTPSGERWMVEASSLDVKIQSELEFIHQTPDVLTSSHQSEPVRTQDEPVRTRSDAYAPEQTRSHHDEQPKAAYSLSEHERELEAKVRSLKSTKPCATSKSNSSRNRTKKDNRPF